MQDLSQPKCLRWTIAAPAWHAGGRLYSKVLVDADHGTKDGRTKEARAANARKHR